MRAAILAASLAASLAVSGDAPRLAVAPVSVPAPNVIGGGVAAVEATVREGRVTSVRGLLGESAFLDRLEADVAGWRFEHTGDEAPVLVAGVYRPPELILATPLEPGPTRSAAADSLPLPVHVEVPAYPPEALGAGVVVLEVEVDATGAVGAIRTVHAGAGFESTAREAARGWRFRPARASGRPVAARAVIAFVLREPIAHPPRKA